MKKIKHFLILAVIILSTGAIFIAARHFMNQDDDRDALVQIQARGSFAGKQN